MGEILRIQHDLDAPVLRPSILRVVTGHRPGIRKADRLKTLPTHATSIDEEPHDSRSPRGGQLPIRGKLIPILTPIGTLSVCPQSGFAYR